MRAFGRVVLLCACFGVGLATAFLSAGGGRAAGGTLSGSVGPDNTMSISFSASSVEEGTYTISIDDQGTIHNFDLLSPGGGSAFSTPIMGTGTFSGDVTLTPGTWTYRCDVHSATMHGSFDVTAAATTSSSSSSTTDTTSTTSTTTTSSTSTSTATSTTASTSTETTTTGTTSTTTASTSTSTQSTTQTQETTTNASPPPARISVGSAARRNRTLLETVTTNLPGTATLTLLHGRKRVARARFHLHVGKNRLRLTAPRRTHGRHVLVTSVATDDGTTKTVKRTVRLP